MTDTRPTPNAGREVQIFEVQRSQLRSRAWWDLHKDELHLAMREGRLKVVDDLAAGRGAERVR